MNNVNIIGRLTKDIEIKKTSNNLSVAHFSIAVNGNNKDKVYFFNAVVWREKADYLGRYAHKGSLIAITGELTTNSYINRDNQKITKVEILCDSVQLLSYSKNASNNEETQVNYDNETQDSTNDNESQELTEDDLPF